VVTDLAALVRRSGELAAADDWGPEARSVNARLADAQPNAAGVWLRLGNCAEFAGDLDDAEQAFRTVLRLQPSTRVERIARHRLIAVAELREARKVREPETARRRAMEHRDAGRTEAADIWFTHAVRLAGTSGEKIAVLTAWASMLRSERKFEEAHEVLREAISLDASRMTNKASFVAWAATLADLGQVAAARHEVDRLRSLHRRDEYLDRLEHRIAALERRRR
jgi:tetratricopeptide (TPR) repeat protein